MKQLIILITALLFAFCSSKRQSRELSRKVDYLSYADTGSLASLNLNRAQIGYLWRLDTWGCYGFRRKLDMTEIIAGMSADEMRNFLGKPRFLNKGKKFDHYIYVVSTDYCKSGVSSKNATVLSKTFVTPENFRN